MMMIIIMIIYNLYRGSSNHIKWFSEKSSDFLRLNNIKTTNYNQI